MKQIIEAIGVICLVVMLYMTFVTEFRTCEIKDQYENVVSVKCNEVYSNEK